MAPTMNPGMQRGIDRQIRKTGQLHGQDRRDYKAAQEAGRGKSFMRRFQNEAGQAQQGIAKEAESAFGYQPQQQPQQPRPQQQGGGGWLGQVSQANARPWSPGGQGDMLSNLVGSGGQPMRPLAQTLGQQVDPGHNSWDKNNLQSTYLPLPNAGASVTGYPGIINDMLSGGAKFPGMMMPGGVKPMQRPGMAQGFGGRRPWAPNQRSQTSSPGIGLNGQRINYSR